MTKGWGTLELERVLDRALALCDMVGDDAQRAQTLYGLQSLFVIHAISLSMSIWFLGLAGISVLGAVGTMYLVWRAHEESENEELLRLLWPHHLLFILNDIGGAALALLFAYICDVGNLQASNGLHGMPGMLALGIVLLFAVTLDGSALVSNRYWRKAIIYARTGRVPNLHEE